jgi:isopropylmalate/homocitrate/citramalate synthase
MDEKNLQELTESRATTHNQDMVFVDCTLRDGEQAAGVFFTHQEKLAIADLLDALGIDVLDAGMPSVSEDECRTIEALLERGYRARIAGTVRALKSDIEVAVRCGLEHVFLFMPVSPQHLKHKFGITLRDAIPVIEGAVGFATSQGLNVNFVAEDSVRADPIQLAAVFDRVSELGAQTAIVCDTVGVMNPDKIEKYVGTLRMHMQSGIMLGIHCHNDYGLGTANTIAAVSAGCRMVTATVNGLGERAGNAHLEEILCAIEDIGGTRLRMNRSVLPGLCMKVAIASGVFFPPTKPIVGMNVFRHESGVHVDGMLKDHSTYESISPEGLGRQHEFVLGKHSGRGLVETLLAGRNIEAKPETVARILKRIKQAKEARDKTPFLETAQNLNRFWAEHLSFPEADFWTIAHEELATDSQEIGEKRSYARTNTG